MPRKQTTFGNLALAGYEEIFNTGNSGLDCECVLQIPLTDLHPPEFHPFQVNDDAPMHRLAESIKEYGVREPGIARTLANGGYELLCGNRRKRACQLAGLTTMPIIIRELDDNLASIIMIDSNLERRDRILPSEKAWAYKVMMEALNHNGIKGDKHSFEVMMERTGESKNQIFRIIRMTELIITLLDKVDLNQLAFNPAVELSYLSQTEQTAVANFMEIHGIKPSLSQAAQLKKLKQDGKLTKEIISHILSEEKKKQNAQSGNDQYRRFFPQSYSPKQIDAVIVKLLTAWKASN
jgi:ParB family chromosome partitioning protein